MVAKLFKISLAFLMIELTLNVIIITVNAITSLDGQVGAAFFFGLSLLVFIIALLRLRRELKEHLAY